MKLKIKRLLPALGVIGLLFSLTASSLYFLTHKAMAGTLTNSSVLEMGSSTQANPMIASDPQAIAIDFSTVSSVSSGGTITITFNNWGAGTVSATQGNPTHNAAGTACDGTLFSGATALPASGTLTAAGSGTTITISSVGALSATTNYCTEIASTSGTTAVVNPAAGVYTVTISDGTDSQTGAIDVLSSGGNAYSITGTITPSFTMSLSGTTDTFSGNLSFNAVTLSTGITTTINTNAKSGWFVWADDSNAGLHSTQAAKTIPSESTGSNHTMNGGTIGTEEYAFGVSADNTANYAYGGGTTGGGLATGVFNEIATLGTPASNVQFVTHELADISATTPPATDYTDTITEIGAGSF